MVISLPFTHLPPLATLIGAPSAGRFPGGADAGGLQRPLAVRTEPAADGVEADLGRRHAAAALRQTRQLVLQPGVSVAFIYSAPCSIH